MASATTTKDDPLISIITITFNAEQFLESTIKSIVGQDYPNIEYIVIDGGSTDRTVDIIHKYQDDISYWLSEPDRGISDAWNKGLAAASGEIIGLLNAGDYFLDPSYLSIVSSQLNVNEAVVCYCNTQLVNQSGNKVKHIIGKFNPNNLYSGIGFYHPGCFATRKTYDLVGSFSLRYKLAMDCDWLFRCYRAGTMFKKIEVDTAMLDGGVSNNLNFSAYGEYLQALKDNKFGFMSIYLSMINVGVRGIIKSVVSKR